MAKEKVKDEVFAAAVKNVQKQYKKDPTINGLAVLASIVGLTVDSAKQRIYNLIREPKMVEVEGADGTIRTVNKGGKGLPRELFEFLLKGSGTGKGNRKDLGKLADLYESMLADEDEDETEGEDDAS